jgi:hypothetical protein
VVVDDAVSLGATSCYKASTTQVTGSTIVIDVRLVVMIFQPADTAPSNEPTCQGLQLTD